MNDLQKYKCHKTVHAKPLTYSYFRLSQGLEEVSEEDGAQEGYLVVYDKGTPDHYESWSPKAKFEDGYFLIPEQDSASPIMRYFAYEHLPDHLQKISKPLGDIAQLMDAMLPDGAEKTVGLRKLLEAKDCFVRASLDKKPTS